MIRALLTLLFLSLGTATWAETLRLAVTTSFNNSGLSDLLLPEIEEDTGITVQLVIVGTGQALRLGRAGDVDAILVHSRDAEERFVKEGFGSHRREIMYNDFVIVGPDEDPAGIAQARSAAEALTLIAARRPPYVSRGDDSGTHKKERAIWREARLDPATFGDWYKEVGASMGASLNTAAALDAYLLTDRASWLNFENRGGLEVLFEGDAILHNQYAYIPVDPDFHPHVKNEAAKTLESWLTGPKAHELIDGYRIDGQKLFTFNADGATSSFWRPIRGNWQ